MSCNGTEKVKYSRKIGKLVLDTEVSDIDASSDYQSTAIDVESSNFGSLSLIWSGFLSFNGRAILQGSNDGTNWNDLGGADGGIVLDLENDIQLWEITNITYKYLRLDYTANNVSSGTFTIQFKGYG